MIAPTLAELRSMTEEEIIRRHDEKTPHVQVGISYLLEELARRDRERAAQRMLYCTYAITGMTLVITAATLYNVFG